MQSGRTRAFWNIKQVDNPTVARILAVTRLLRTEGDVDSRQLAERIKRAARANLLAALKHPAQYRGQSRYFSRTARMAEATLGTADERLVEAIDLKVLATRQSIGGAVDVEGPQ